MKIRPATSADFEACAALNTMDFRLSNERLRMTFWNLTRGGSIMTDKIKRSTAIILVLFTTVLTTSCANMVKGSLTSMCQQQCQKNSKDAQSHQACLQRCEGPR